MCLQTLSLPIGLALRSTTCCRPVVVPEADKQRMAFFRVWCLIEVYAAQQAGKPIAMRCGSIRRDGTGAFHFEPDKKTLFNILKGNLVDVSEAQTKNPWDRERLLAKLDKGAGRAALNSFIQGSIESCLTQLELETPSLVAEVCGEVGALLKAREQQQVHAIAAAASCGLVGLLRQELNPALADRECGLGHTPLMRAASCGHTPVILLLVHEYNAIIDRRNGLGCSALSVASENGHESSVTALLDLKADVDVEDHKNKTPLLYSVRNGHHAVVRILLMRRADVEKRDQKGYNALMTAARFGHCNSVKALVAANAKLDISNNGVSALMWAARNGHANAVEELVNAKAQVDTEWSHMSDNWSALMWAASKGHEGVVRCLVKARAQVNARSPEELDAAAIEPVQLCMGAVGRSVPSQVSALPAIKRAPSGILALRHDHSWLGALRQTRHLWDVLGPFAIVPTSFTVNDLV